MFYKILNLTSETSFNILFIRKINQVMFGQNHMHISTLCTLHSGSDIFKDRIFISSQNSYFKITKFYE